MGKLLAAAGVQFFVLAPGVVAGVIPWWITGWQIRDPLPYWAPLRVVGVVLIVLGVLVLLQAFARFVTEGMGTIATAARRHAGGHAYVPGISQPRNSLV